MTDKPYIQMSHRHMKHVTIVGQKYQDRKNLISDTELSVHFLKYYYYFSLIRTLEIEKLHIFCFYFIL